MKRAAWRTPLLVLAAFVLLTVLLTYPLSFHLADAVEDGQDALLNVWIMAWDGHALLTDPLQFFNANIFYPYGNTLAYSEINLSQALLALPASLASGNPVLGYNLALFLTFVLSGWGMYLLVRRLAGSEWGGLAAGIVFAFNAYKLSNLAQIQLVSLHWLPFALLCLDAILRPAGRQAEPAFGAAARPDPVVPLSRYVLLSAFLVLQALASFYYAIFTVLVVALYLACYLVVRGRSTRAGTWLRLVAAGLVAVAVCLPFAIPYFQVQRELGFQRSLAENEPFSASLSMYAEALPGNVVYGRLLAPSQPVTVGGYALDSLFPGLAAGLLAAYGAWAWRRRRETIFYSALVLVALLLSLGPALYLNPQTRLDLPFSLPYAWLYAVVPGFQALRAPLRFAVLAFLGLAVFAGYGVAALASAGTREPEAATAASGPPTKRRPWLGLAAAGLVALECLTLPAARVHPVPTGDAVPPVYRWLAQQPPATIIELPLGDRDPTVTLTRQYLSTYHWQRTPDGYSGFIPPKHGEMAYEMLSFPSARSLALLRGYGVEYVVVHGDRPYAGLPPSDLPLVQSFGTDRVYRLAPKASRPSATLSAYLPAEAAPGRPYDAYLIVQSQGDAPLVVLPTHRPVVLASWTLADGSARRESVALSLPIVTSEASVVPVTLQPPPGDPRSLTLVLDDPILGHLESSVTLRQAAASPAFPVPVRLVAATVTAHPTRAGADLQPGDSLRVSLAWRALGKVDAYYSSFAALLDRNRQPLDRKEGEPQQGRRPTLLWAPGEEVTEEYVLAVPPQAAPGRYAVEVGLYRAGDLAAAMTLDAAGRPLPRLMAGQFKIRLPAVTARPQQMVNAVLGGRVALLGYDLSAGGDAQTITLYWQALQPLDKDYTVFLHVLAPDGRILDQRDSQPRAGQYPTGIWSPGEVVPDSYQLRLGAGEYRLAVGMYDLTTMARLPVGGDDKVMLAGTIGR